MSIFEGKPLKELDIHFDDHGKVDTIDLVTDAGTLLISDPKKITYVLEVFSFALRADLDITAYLTWFLVQGLKF